MHSPARVRARVLGSYRCRDSVSVSLSLYLCSSPLLSSPLCRTQTDVGRCLRRSPAADKRRGRRLCPLQTLRTGSRRARHHHRVHHQITTLQTSSLLLSPAPPSFSCLSHNTPLCSDTDCASVKSRCQKAPGDASVRPHPRRVQPIEEM